MINTQLKDTVQESKPVVFSGIDIEASWCYEKEVITSVFCAVMRNCYTRHGT